jgi:hypothetical protein
VQLRTVLHREHELLAHEGDLHLPAELGPVREDNVVPGDGDVGVALAELRQRVAVLQLAVHALLGDVLQVHHLFLAIHGRHLHLLCHLKLPLLVLRCCTSYGTLGKIISLKVSQKET